MSKETPEQVIDAIIKRKVSQRRRDVATLTCTTKRLYREGMEPEDIMREIVQALIEVREPEATAET